MALALTRARRLVDGGLDDDDSAFAVLQAIGAHGASPGNRDRARELLIRLLEQRDAIPDALQDLLQGLLREHGLFPYLHDIDELPLRDQLAYEIHRPAAVPGGRDLVFHAEQAVVYQRLLAGENVVLSAPTSFGKSLVIDAVLAAQDSWRNVAVIVPTVALIDEMRRRLSALQDRYKIITHGSQEPEDRNLYVMTQERMLDLPELPDFDFFAIDEFYKLDPAHSDDRSSQLNILFQRLLATGAQFYLLGPNITGLTPDTARNLRATFVPSEFTTVVTDVRRETASKNELPERVPAVCHELGPKTIVFCSSPGRARKVAGWLLEAGVGGGSDLADAAAWVAEAYHPEWLVSRALSAGIGIHHGKLPRALAHHIVRLFNQGRLPYLVVTSTLIEGVNTTARNVVVVDHKIAGREYDYFTYANIRGRSGRMFHHFVGNVVVFNDPPRPADLNVDVPVLSQSPTTSEDILIQLPWEQLNDASRERVRPYYEQDLVSLDTLRANKGVAPSRQIATAEKIARDRSYYTKALGWRSFPTAAQVRAMAEVLYDIAKPDTRSQTVVSAKQLGRHLNVLRHHQGDLRALVAEEVQGGRTPDDAVEFALDFARQWAQFKLPRAFATVERLAVEVLDRRTVADTRGFARQVEGLFQPALATVLEEFGLPLPVTVKLDRYLRLRNVDDLDTALERLRAIPPNPAGLGPFEREMLLDTQAAL